VATLTVVRNMEAAAMALCQKRPLLLEGPPGGWSPLFLWFLASPQSTSSLVERGWLHGCSRSKKFLEIAVTYAASDAAPPGKMSGYRKHSWHKKITQHPAAHGVLRLVLEVIMVKKEEKILRNIRTCFRFDKVSKYDNY